MIKKAVIISSLFAFLALTAGVTFAQTATPTATTAPTAGVTTTPSPTSSVPGEAPSTGRGI